MIHTVGDYSNDEFVFAVSQDSNNNNDQIWLLDSGFTSHMTDNIKIYDNIEEGERKIALADKEGKKLCSKGIGEVVIKQSSSKNNIKLKNVLCVPELNTNLTSVAKMTDNDYNVQFNRYGAIVYIEPNDVKMTAVRIGNAYYVRSFVVKDESANMTNEVNLWHQILGHANKRVVEEMKREELVIGMNEEKLKTLCEPCVEGKTCRKAHHRLEQRRTKRIMELWHMDLIGPIKPISCGAKQYILTIIDDYSRVLFVKLIQEKGHAAEGIKNLIVLKENLTGHKLKAIRSDNGGEYIGSN